MHLEFDINFQSKTFHFYVLIVSISPLSFRSEEERISVTDYWLFSKMHIPVLNVRIAIPHLKSKHVNNMLEIFNSFTYIKVTIKTPEQRFKLSQLNFSKFKITKLFANILDTHFIGHIECLKFVFDNSRFLDTICPSATANGQNSFWVFWDSTLSSKRFP